MEKLTQQQENFVQEYIKCGIGRQAYIKAYPKAKNWSLNAVDVQANRLLNNPKVSLRLSEYNKKVESTLAESTTLNQRKLLESALMILEDCQRTPSQYANAINVLKLLYAQQGMMPKDTPQIQINNNTQIITAEVSDYLNL